MASATALLGVGSYLQVNTGSYVTVAGVVSIKGPKQSVHAVKYTDLQATTPAHDYLPGILEGGSVTIECNFTAAQFNTLYGLLQTTKAWRIVMSNGSKWDWNGFIEDMDNDIPLEEVITMPITIKVSNKPTFTS